MKRMRFALALAFVIVAAWLVAGRQPVAFSVTFFDVGQGDSALVTTPDRTFVLIDGGPSRAVLTKLGQALPFGVRTLDLVVLSHPHADHLAGLAYVLQRYRVKHVLMTDATHTTPEYIAFLELVREQDIPVTIARAGQRFDIGAGARLEVLWPAMSYAGARTSDLNATSIVSRIVYGSTAVLFTGDTPIENEASLLASGADVKAQLLKVAHQGSRTSSSEEFIRAVSPETAVVSVGADNRFGHPHEDVILRLTRLVPAVLRTDQDGDIRFESDGARWTRP